MTQTMHSVEPGAVRSREREQQLVLFQLSGEDYGVDIYGVQRLIQVPAITRVPRAPIFVVGVIDVRGDIIPVINLKMRFGFGNTEMGDSGRIVIVEIGDQIVGFLVDGVSEVTTLSEEDIEPLSEILASVDTEYIAGIGKQHTGDKSRLIIVLDPKKILSQEERASLAEMQQKAAEEEPTVAVKELEETPAPAKPPRTRRKAA
jgi:purine-binding chemotaxis protein CheW